MSLDEPFDRVEEAATRIGSVLDGRWTVDSLLGIGGMAAVYAASDGKQRVAIKVLHSDLSRSQRALERFRREGEALRAALHPAVPRVHGEGTTVDDCPYLFMDLLLGETVEARRRRFGGRLPPAEVVRIALVVLDVLEVVHARGLLHRDVKPSNVLWLDDGSIRLIDFGIAAAVQKHEEDVVTRTGELPGSLAFMSPEHALGVPGELDARSDLWSLGATMFLLLSGRPVHESKTEVEALALSASREARSLASVVSGLPPTIVAVVDRALSFERRRRFLDAAEMREALLAPPSVSSHVTPRSPRRWSSVLGATATALVLVGGLAAWTASSGRMETAGEGAPAVTSAPGLTTSSVAAVRVAPVSEMSTEPGATSVTEIVAQPALAGGPVLRMETARSSVAHRAAPPAAASPPPSASGAPVAASPPRCDPPFVIDPVTGTRRVKPGC